MQGNESQHFMHHETENDIWQKVDGESFLQETCAAFLCNRKEIKKEKRKHSNAASRLGLEDAHRLHKQ